MKQRNAILFYRVGDLFGCFSNFAPYPIKLDDRVWPTAEHYFQAMKFARVEYQERIRMTPSPMVAARLGRSRQEPIRSDWEAVKLDVMERALRAKFGQHTELQKLLIETGDREIVEHTSRDGFWGDAGDGSGGNHLGELLMRIREEFQRSHASPTFNNNEASHGRT
ncbi:MAG: NADAR family protein [Planctomycetes bacterium]|nr:NADAR family protein [Planctomycetota bacterium]